MIAKLEQQGKKIFRWGEELVDIITLENLVYEAAFRWGREIMRRYLEETDRILSRQRNKTVYRDKGYRPTTLKTVMGEVGYRRHVYLLSGEAEQHGTDPETYFNECIVETAITLEEEHDPKNPKYYRNFGTLRGSITFYVNDFNNQRKILG